jgi:hypothetical protein
VRADQACLAVQPYNSENLETLCLLGWGQRLRMGGTAQREQAQKTGQECRDGRELDYIIDGFSYKKYTGYSTLQDTGSHEHMLGIAGWGT